MPLSRRLFCAAACVAVLAGCAPQPRVVPLADPGPYRLGTGDKLRVTVFAQQNLSSTYTVDASGQITMPLIGNVTAAGATTDELEKRVEAKLRNGFLRDPDVSVEVDTYRPFFILGEVQAPGQYAYVPGMTAEQAIAVGGGYSPRGLHDQVEISRNTPEGLVRQTVPSTTRIAPGDTVTVRERWF